MRPRILPTILVRFLSLLQLFQVAHQSLFASRNIRQPRCGLWLARRCDDDQDEECALRLRGATALVHPPAASLFGAAVVATDVSSEAARNTGWCRARHEDRMHPPAGCSSSFHVAPRRTSEPLRTVLIATCRGGGARGYSQPRRRISAASSGRRRDRKRRSVVNDKNDHFAMFNWDDVADVLRSLSTRSQDAWNHRVRPFLQHRVLPVLRDPGASFGNDSQQSSKTSQHRPAGTSRRLRTSTLVQVCELQHLIILAVAGCVVGDVLPSSPSSAVDFDFVLGVSAKPRTSSRSSHGREEADVAKGIAEWWNSVLRDPKNVWKPLSKATPTVQRIVGSVIGILASQLVRPIVPAAVRVAIAAMVAGEANAFLCNEYGEGWYETHANNDHVDKWLSHLDDALERWRQFVRSTLLDPATTYRRLRRTVDSQLQKEMAIPTHVANGMIGGVVVGLVAVAGPTGP